MPRKSKNSSYKAHSNKPNLLSPLPATSSKNNSYQYKIHPILKTPLIFFHASIYSPSNSSQHSKN
jgi:hypothetical protein